MDYASRKFMIFCIGFVTFTGLFIAGLLSQGNYLILIGEDFAFYLGGNAWDSHIKSKNGGKNGNKN